MTTNDGPGVPPERAPETTSVYRADFLADIEPPAREQPVSGVDALPAGAARQVVKRGPHAGSRFQLDGIRTSLRTEVVVGTDCRPSRVGDRVIRAVQRHADGQAQSDDIALVCFGRTEGGPGTGSQLLPRLVEPLGLSRTSD